MSEDVIIAAETLGLSRSAALAIAQAG